MMHFFKKREIVLECFTDRPELITDAPIDKAYNYMPEWWKALPRPCLKQGEMSANANMRHCPGIVELYKNSIAIPLWSDLKIMVVAKSDESREYRWQFADKVSTISVHPASQRGDYLPEQSYQHLKLDTPWMLKTNKFVKWAWYGAVWNVDAPESFIVPPGVDEYYYQHSSNINIFVPKNNEIKEVVIPFRQPLVLLTPMSDEKVRVKHTLVSREELLKIDHVGSYTPKFFNSYYTKKKIRSTK